MKDWYPYLQAHSTWCAKVISRPVSQDMMAAGQAGTVKQIPVKNNETSVSVCHSIVIQCSSRPTPSEDRTTVLLDRKPNALPREPSWL